MNNLLTSFLYVVDDSFLFESDIDGQSLRVEHKGATHICAFGVKIASIIDRTIKTQLHLLPRRAR